MKPERALMCCCRLSGIRSLGIPCQPPNRVPKALAEVPSPALSAYTLRPETLEDLRRPDQSVVANLTLLGMAASSEVRCD